MPKTTWLGRTSKKLLKKGGSAAWRGTKVVASKSGSSTRAAAARRASRRASIRSAREAHLSRGATRTQSWFARHPFLAEIRDAVVQKGHEWMDHRDLRSGIITEEELNLLSQYDSQEEWREEVRRRRRETYKQYRLRDRDTEFGPLTQVVALNGSSTAKVVHVGFRPPAPRRGPVPVPQSAGWSPPTPRVRRRKRKDRAAVLAAAWRPQMEQNASKAMAADADLSAAKTALLAFVETFPETRSQVHEHGGKLAEFGKTFAEAMETFQATMLAGRGEDNPGMPEEVVARLKPLSEVGDTIVSSCLEFVAAWEDYFQEAIKAARDEHTPSRQALTS